MNWADLLRSSAESTYRSAEQLLDLVEDEHLGWKPTSGSNWMTTGQLLKHISDSCGSGFKGFVTGDWGFPEGVDPNNIPMDQMMPPAEKLPTVSSVAEAKRLLGQDKQLALAMLAKVGENDLNSRLAPAPWDKEGMVLGPRLLQMIAHLAQHKGQLFYYLKLQGKPVHTGHLWGM